MAHATSFPIDLLPAPSVAPAVIPAQRDRPSSWQRFLDALDRLGLGESAPTKAGAAYGYAFRTRPLR